MTISLLLLLLLLLLLSLHAANAGEPGALAPSCSWWYEQTPHHGFAFRNVSAFGAIGDGEADDTAALQRAIDSNRGGEPGSEQSKAAAVVYLGPGTYKVTDTLVLWKWTVLIGNPRCPPTLVLPPQTPSFEGAHGLKPLLVTAVGFNASTAAHAWWDQSGPNAVNEHFFTSVRHLRVISHLPLSLSLSLSLSLTHTHTHTLSLSLCTGGDRRGQPRCGSDQLERGPADGAARRGGDGSERYCGRPRPGRRRRLREAEGQRRQPERGRRGRRHRAARSADGLADCGHPGLAAQRRCPGQHAAGRAGSPRRLVTGRAEYQRGGSPCWGMSHWTLVLLPLVSSCNS